jgi:hypothetical protein
LLFGTTGPGATNLLLSLTFGIFLLLVVELEKWIIARLSSGASDNRD